MDVCGPEDIHGRPTASSGLMYCFRPKHRGAGSAGDARWRPDLSREEEFGVFEIADANGWSDDNGNLYGLYLVKEGGRWQILELGIRGELIARFWHEAPAVPWHGHPLWPIEASRSGAGGSRSKIDEKQLKIALKNMSTAGLSKQVVISEVHRKRLLTGKHVRYL